MDEIEGDVKQVGKKIKRTWFKIFVFMVFLIGIAAVVLFYAGMTIKFVIQDSLDVAIDPVEGSFTIKNDESQTVNFDVTTENSIFCSAICNYVFYDRSEENIIDEGYIDLEAGGQFNKKYQISPNRKGSGQRIYNFDVRCSNVRSFLCPTNSPIRRRSSFIILNYVLTESEVKIKDNIKGQISKDIQIVNNIGSNLQKSIFMLDHTNNLIGKSNLIKVYVDLEDVFKNIVENAEILMKLWEMEEYDDLNESYQVSLVKESISFFGRTEILVNDIIKSVESQNSLIEEYNNLGKSFSQVVSSSGYVKSHNVSIYNLEDDFDQVMFMANGKYSSLDVFENDLDNISEGINQLNVTLKNNYDSIVDRGNNLTFLEYSKKCGLGYCEKIPKDLCLGLSEIINEYNRSLYIVVFNGTNISVKLNISNESLTFFNNYCLNNDTIQIDITSMEKLTVIDALLINTTDMIVNELSENPPMCCVYNDCSPCCANEDCGTDPKLYPVMLIHGHSLLRTTNPDPLLDGFNKIQYQMLDDGFINAGTIRFDANKSQHNEKEWGLAGYPITIKASYYFDYFYSFGNFIYVSRRADNIDTYAIRLREIIDLIKYKTGKDKINIIAHSMGGLVARRYIQIFGEDSVSKLILIGTPNHGIEGNVKKFCTVFGDELECEDMYDDSVFINKLNDPYYYPKQTKFYTISGKGCPTNGKEGDGVIVFERSKLHYAKSYVVEGVCSDTFETELHGNLINIDKYPEVYEYIQEILAE